DEDSAHRRGERPQRPASLDLRQHDAERDRAGSEYSGGNVEERATDDYAPVMRLGEPHLGGIETEVCARGQVEVSNAQPANGGEQDKDPIARKPELQGAKSSRILHGYFLLNDGLDLGDWTNHTNGLTKIQYRRIACPGSREPAFSAGMPRTGEQNVLFG